jgi:hypothetical protein
MVYPYEDKRDVLCPRKKGQDVPVPSKTWFVTGSVEFSIEWETKDGKPISGMVGAAGIEPATLGLEIR